MSLDVGSLDAFADLAVALGMLDGDRNVNTNWFADPVNGSADPDQPRGLRTIMADDDQRNALLAFVDGVLGDPDRSTRDGAVWVPLFTDPPGSASPRVVISAVVDASDPNVVIVGIGAEHTTAPGAVQVSSRVHVPVFRSARTEGPALTGNPRWLALGQPGGRIAVTVDATFGATAGPAGVSIGAIAVTAEIPTHEDDNLAVHLELRDVVLPGATAPRTFVLDADSLAELGRDVLDLLLALVHAQADVIDMTDATQRPFGALCGMLGLRAVAGLPAFPLSDLPTRGVDGIVDWFDQLLADTVARDAWLGELAELLGAVPDPEQNAVCVTTGALTVCVGLRVTTGTGGQRLLTPWVDVRFDTATGALVRTVVDVLTADLATGSVTAVPSLRAEAVLGADAGGAALLTGSPAVGSLHAGIGLDANRRPVVVLTLHDVTFNGRSYPLLDLSTPDAALDAATGVIGTALSDALTALGPGGAIAATLLGLTPPAGVSAVDPAAVLADPVGALRSYWVDLVASVPGLPAVLGDLRELLTGAAGAVPGMGIAADPWVIALPAGIALLVVRDGRVLTIDARLANSITVFGDHGLATSGRVTLARIDLAVPTVDFVGDVAVTAELRGPGGGPLHFDLGPAVLYADAIVVTGAWRPRAATGGGLAVDLDAPGLTLEIEGVGAVAQQSRLPIPLPVRVDGRLRLDPVEWTAAQNALGALLRTMQLPSLDALVDLLGWGSGAVTLDVADLITGTADEARAALAAWIGGTALDCVNLRRAVGAIAGLLSGFARTDPIGDGSAAFPYLAPIAGHRQAPGIAAWLEPGCPPSTDQLGRVLAAGGSDPTLDGSVAALAAAADTLIDVAELLVGRPGLGAGLESLVARWVGTDGIVGAPASVPADVTPLVMEGYGYDDLVAYANQGWLLSDALAAPPAAPAVLYAGCESSMLADRAAGTAFDLSGTVIDPSAAVPAAGAGVWFARLPAPSAAAAARPERGGVGEQAARLATLLASRTDPIIVVGHGAAGAAAIRAAATVAAISDVITVGTPWAPVSVEGLRSDALRLLGTLEPVPSNPDEVAWPEDIAALQTSPGRLVRSLVTRSRVFAAPGDLAITLPLATDEPRRAGLRVAAVFGSVPESELVAGIAGLVDDAVRIRAELAGAIAEVEHDSLHAGVQLPVFNLDIGGLLIGAGAILELCALERADTVTGLAGSLRRRLIVDVRIGVTDGWLVGGPGAASDELELRWMSARIAVSLDGGGEDADTATAEFVLHDARAFDARRERWVVRAGADGITATTALPEVRILLSSVVARLSGASPAIGDLLAACGLVRDGGIEPLALDRLLHDPALTIAGLGPSAASIASALRSLIPGATGTLSALSIPAGSASITVDLAAGLVSATATTAPSATRPDVPPASVTLTASATSVALDASLGALSADAGGLRLVGSVRALSASGAAPAPTAAALTLEWAAPGAAEPRRLSLLPLVGPEAIGDLLSTVLPALGIRIATEAARRLATSPALDSVLAITGLLVPASASAPARLVLPIGLVDDPAAWLRHAVVLWRSDPIGAATALVDALAPLAATGPIAAGEWPIAVGTTLRRVTVDGRVHVTGHVVQGLTIGAGGNTTDVSVEIDAGLAIGSDGSALPALTATVLLGATGLRLTLTPALTVELVRAAPAAPLRLHPGPVGIGDVVSAVGGLVLPPVLDALHAERTAAGSALPKRAAQASFDVCTALDLITAGSIDAAKLSAFAADPGGRLMARIPQLAATAIGAIAQALDPVGAVVSVATPTPDRTELRFATAATIALHTSLSSPAIAVSATVDIASIGTFTIEELRLSTAGLSVSAQIGPFELDLGGAVLRPLLVIRAGNGVGPSGRLVGIGLASLVGPARTESVQFRWTLDASPPTVVAVTTLPDREEIDEDPIAVAAMLAAIAASMAVSVVVPQLSPLLDTPVAGVEPGDLLQGVLFTDAVNSRNVDPAVFSDLTDADALLARLQRLAWNLASSPLTLTIDETVDIALVSQAMTGTRRNVGVRVSLAPGARLTLVDSDLRVDLEVDGAWIRPAVAGDGLSVYVLSGDPADADFGFRFDPGVLIAGIGLRFLQTSGPLLDLGGVSLDAIALHLYGEAAAAGTGGGARVRLDGLAVAPGGTGGTNAVANNILSDAGSAGAANRPVLAPSLAIQKHPGSDLAVTLGLADPPGPWWVIVQRQLGPLYVERVGLDTADAAGRITRISLLFDGRVSLFGLTASVDRLSLTWLGGDVFDLSEWAVDVAGFAVSADMSGISLAGGLLKTDQEGEAAYVGMLLGRFGIYGLSVFGGYTTTNGSPSFFVFGAVTGPFGGPPAFFLTGLGGGLGINRGLRVPSDLSTFGEYPFIKALDPAASAPADPMVELRSLSEYFPPQAGTFWFAAGISFTSFALVDGIAVVSVAFGNGLEINLFGLARMALPRPQAALVSIEIGLLARFSSEEGVFSIQGQLTDNSWLLYPDVRLTGGFAFAVWWKGPLAGQFVLTMGGYHPDFRRDGYPEVPRLGITWQVTDDIVVKGGSYFALTSEALMAGSDVEVVADFGWAWARLAFGAHGIVYFDPFWFEVRAYVEISAGVKIKTWFGTISFSVSLGAQVKIWGPEFSGEAKFGVGPCTLKVRFGSKQTVEPVTLVWTAFVAKYLEDAGGAARSMSAITGRGTLPASTGGAVGAPSSDGTFERPFEVSAEFEVTIVSTIPLTRLDAAAATQKSSMPIRSDGALISLGLSPMRASGLTAVMALGLEKFNPATAVWTSETLAMIALTENLRVAQPTETGTALLSDNFPLGVWGEPAPDNLPAPAIPSGDVVKVANRVRIVAEAKIAPQSGPPIDYYRTENGWKPLPLQARATGRAAIIITSSAFVRNPGSVSEALELASSALFDARSDARPVGVLATGTRSRLAAAGFAGERTAPPLFGTLADGIASANGASTRSTAMPPKEGPRYDGPRQPEVLAHLLGGTGAAAKGPITTFSNGAITRRPAPTVASTRARLATSLPIRLVMTETPGAAGRTVVPPAVPFTDAPVTVRSQVPGVDGADLLGLVGGLVGDPSPDVQRRGRGAARADEPRQIRPGDVVVLHVSDAAADSDAERRPKLTVKGNARVVMLRGDGSPISDAHESGKIEIAVHTRFVAVQASAARPDVGSTFIGWQVTSRVAVLAASSAVGTGCVIDVDRATAGAPVGWARAGDVVRGASVVTTRFSSPVHTIAIVLAGSAPQRVDDIGLDLVGADVATAGDGRPEPPVVALSGSSAVLVYRVVPEVGGEAGVSVRVRSGGAWEVAGVLGGDADADTVVALVRSGGIAALVVPLLAPSPSGPITLEWSDAPTRPRRPVKKTPVKKASVKKASVTKAAKKTTAKKASPAKNTAPAVRKTTAKRGTRGTR